MSKARRAFNFNLVAFVGAIFLLLLLSRRFALVSLIGEMQERVMHWGAWGAICYPLLFALCNILLLPGGILSVGSGFFFGLWWGFFIVLLGNSIAAAIAFALGRWLGKRWLSRKLSQSST